MRPLLRLSKNIVFRTASRLKLQFQSNLPLSARAFQAHFPAVGIKTEIHAPGFYENCNSLQFSILCALRREGLFRQTECSAVWQSILFIRGNLLMAVSYKKLWKLLIDKDMKKKDLCARAGISSASVTKMGRNGHVTTEILLKICTALNCGIEDIIEIVPDDK